MNIIVIMGPYDSVCYKSQFIGKLDNAFKSMGFRIVYPKNTNELFKLIEHTPQICGVVFDHDDFNSIPIHSIHQFNENLPLYVLINTYSQIDINSKQTSRILYFFHYFISTVEEIISNVYQCTNEYIDNITPPLTKALFNYVKKNKYTFCTPGHMGGSAFQKNPIGNIFYDFFGGNMLKADISISVTELGSLLDHTGSNLEAEKYIAHTFGAERSYIVTNGTSTSNKIVGMYAAPESSTVLIDRNCHTSVVYWLIMNNIVPIWLKPTRNALGIFGGIPKNEFSRNNIQQKVNTTPNARWPIHAVITNSTYDGLLYNTNYIKQMLEVKSIHFDSAWISYANFHPIYIGKSAMYGDRISGKVIYETQSMHKLLSGFSQGSLIHIKGDYDEKTFNEAYMMNMTTSPNYIIVSSVEITAAMLRGNSGKQLIKNSIEHSFYFRRELKKLNKESDGWFFDIWQPEEIHELKCWPIQPGDEKWHGFINIDRDHMYLDPIKITIITPGINNVGQMESKGIPALLVAKFLYQHGVVVEKNGAYNLLLLFSIGIDKTKVIFIINKLIEFKRAYDLNLYVKSILPDLYAKDPNFYKKIRIQTLAQELHQVILQQNYPKLMLKAFDVFPEIKMTPHAAFQRQIEGKIETIDIRDMIGRISANMILVYPPGIPIVMPGEMITEKSQLILDYLITLCNIGRMYPGLETNIHGATFTRDYRYLVRVLARY